MAALLHGARAGNVTPDLRMPWGMMSRNSVRAMRWVAGRSAVSVGWEFGAIYRDFHPTVSYALGIKLTPRRSRVRPRSSR